MIPAAITTDPRSRPFTTRPPVLRRAPVHLVLRIGTFVHDRGKNDSDAGDVHSRTETVVRGPAGGASENLGHRPRVARAGRSVRRSQFPYGPSRCLAARPCCAGLSNVNPERQCSGAQIFSRVMARVSHLVDDHHVLDRPDTPFNVWPQHQVVFIDPVEASPSSRWEASNIASRNCCPEGLRNRACEGELE